MVGGVLAIRRPVAAAGVMAVAGLGLLVVGGAALAGGAVLLVGAVLAFLARKAPSIVAS